MPTIFNSEHSVFFVGGRGTKTGDANAGGGCTKDDWENVFNRNLAFIMKANGEPHSDDTKAWNPGDNACTVTESGSGKVLITCVGAFVDFSAWRVVTNVEFANPWESYSGRYKTTGVYSTDDTIEIDLTYWGNDTTCRCKVGGAFDELQNAIDNTDADATSPHNVDILDNKGKIYSIVGDQIDVDTGCGGKDTNTWKTIIGIDDNGAELAKGSYVTFDINGQAAHGFTFDGDNIKLKHIYAKDADSTHDGFYIAPSAARFGFVLEDCKSMGCRYGVHADSANGGNILIKGGYYKGDSYAISQTAGRAFEMFGVIAERSNAGPVILVGYYGRTLINGCIFKGNGVATYAIEQDHYWSLLTARNCVFYNIVNGFYLSSGARLHQHNNICVVNAKATGKFINRVSGGIDYSDYSCLWAMDGTPAAAARWGGIGLPGNSIEADPQFADAANGDFRLKPKSPLINKGFRPLGSSSEEGYTTIGAWQRISYLLGMK